MCLKLGKSECAMGECAYNVMDQDKFGFHTFRLSLIPSWGKIEGKKNWKQKWKEKNKNKIINKFKINKLFLYTTLNSIHLFSFSYKD